MTSSAVGVGTGAGSRELAAAPERTLPSATWQQTYATLLVVVDCVLIFVALVAALVLRFGWSADSSLRGYSYTLVAFAAGPTWLASLTFNQAYEQRFLGVGAAEFKRVFLGSVRLFGYTAILCYALKIDLARGFVAIAFPLGTVLLLGGRYGARKWLHARRQSGGWSHRVLVVGDPGAASPLVRAIHREPYAGFRVVGACLLGDDRTDAALDGVPILGTVAGITDVLRECGADTVAVTASPQMTADSVRHLAWRLEGTGVAMVVAPALTDVAGPRISVRPVAGLPLLHVEEPEFTGARRLAKNVQDRLLAAFALLALAPFLALLAALVRITTPGPALFRQQRVGRDGRIFGMYKLRSMVADAEQRLGEVRARNEHDGLLFKLRDDPRVTPFGRWLRRWSLDELPQLWNVVKGDMALVGPRPPLPSEAAEYGYDVKRRLLVKPGVTGLWQISGRADLTWQDSVRLDLYYVENWSFALDLMILWKTAFAVIRRRGAY